MSNCCETYTKPIPEYEASLSVLVPGQAVAINTTRGAGCYTFIPILNCSWFESNTRVHWNTASDGPVVCRLDGELSDTDTESRRTRITLPT